MGNSFKTAVLISDDCKDRPKDGYESAAGTTYSMPDFVNELISDGLSGEVNRNNSNLAPGRQDVRRTGLGYLCILNPAFRKRKIFLFTEIYKNLSARH